MIKKYLIVLFILFTMSGCGRSSLIYKESSLTLSIDEMVQHLKTEPYHSTYKNFQTLFVTQRILRLDEKYIVFEETQTDPTYEYEPSTQKSIKVIFETINIIKVYGKNFLNFYQLTLKDGNVLNLVSQQSDDQQLTLLYGMDTLTFNRMIAHFDTHAPKAKIDDVIQISEASKAIYSKWDVRKIHFKPLVVPLRSLMAASD